jgi:DNA-binding Lrp family transcriptional regulator
MVLAFVLVNCDIAMSESITAAAKKVAGVADVHSITGLYDLIIRADVEDESRLRDVIKKVKQLTGIRATLTNIVYNPTRPIVGTEPYQKPINDDAEVV